MNAGIYITVWLLVFGCWYLVVCRWYLVVGIGFQPKLPTTKHQQPIIIYFYLLIFYSQQSDHKFCLEDNTERSESNPGRSLGITNNKGRAVWKTVPH